MSSTKEIINSILLFFILLFPLNILRVRKLTKITKSAKIRIYGYILWHNEKFEIMEVKYES